MKDNVRLGKGVLYTETSTHKAIFEGWFDNNKAIFGRKITVSNNNLLRVFIGQLNCTDQMDYGVLRLNNGTVY